MSVNAWRREYEERAVRLPGAIAASLGDFGGLLRCMTCGTEQPLPRKAIGRYLQSGWPKHHGYTMRWVTARQLADETTRKDGSTP